MKISSAGIEVPEECPKDCRFKGEVELYGQNAICCRCPVMICPGIIEPEGFCEEAAREWETFFKTGKMPGLNF